MVALLATDRTAAPLGVSFVLSYRVRNEGGRDAIDVVSRLQAGSSLLDGQEAESLPAGETSKATALQWAPATMGWQEVRVEAHGDIDGATQEARPAVARLYVYDPDHPVLPNLQVAALTPGQSADGQTMTVTVKNAGSMAAPPTHLRLSVDGTHYHDQILPVPGIEPGVSVTLASKPVDRSATGWWTATADAAEAVDELSESDNTGRVELAATAAWRVRIDDAWASLAHHHAGQAVTMYLSVVNDGPAAAPRLSMEFTIDGQPSSQEVLPLAPGEARTLSVTASPDHAAVVMAARLLQGTAVIDTASLALPSADSTAAVAIVELCVTSGDRDGEAQFLARVENRGAVQHPGGRLEFVLDGHPLGTPRVPFLLPNGDFTLGSMPWAVAPGDHHLDVYLRLPESPEPVQHLVRDFNPDSVRKALQADAAGGTA